MNRTAKTFGQTAERLSHNPLGIIALFIVLVYLIAGTILGASSLSNSAAKVDSNERLPLVYFIVIYPVLVLIAFYRLVAHHHTKLYSPKDFPDVDGFFRALTPGEQKERLEREIKEIESIEKGGAPAAIRDTVGSIVIPNNRRASWMLALELGIREMENEHQTPIQRQVAYAGQHEVDGVFLKGGVVNVVEVKLAGPSWIPAARLAVNYIDRIAEASHPMPRFTLVMVVRDLKESRLERDMQTLREMLGSKRYMTDIRIYDFDQLKLKYGIVTDDPDDPEPKPA